MRAPYAPDWLDFWTATYGKYVTLSPRTQHAGLTPFCDNLTVVRQFSCRAPLGKRPTLCFNSGFSILQGHPNLQCPPLTQTSPSWRPSPPPDLRISRLTNSSCIMPRARASTSRSLSTHMVPRAHPSPGTPAISTGRRRPKPTTSK